MYECINFFTHMFVCMNAFVSVFAALSAWRSSIDAGMYAGDTLYTYIHIYIHVIELLGGAILVPNHPLGVCEVVCVYVCIHTDSGIYAGDPLYTHIHTYIRTYIHTYIHTYRRAQIAAYTREIPYTQAISSLR
jgi:hypothetical protein